MSVWMGFNDWKCLGSGTGRGDSEAFVFFFLIATQQSDCRWYPSVGSYILDTVAKIILS